MFWKIESGRTLMEPNAEVVNYLIINRVEVLDHGQCAVCARKFTDSPTGEKTLVLALGGNSERTYFFCSTCGDNIVGRVESEESRKRYVWDWTVPLRNGHRAG
jgi:hypothetical protein